MLYLFKATLPDFFPVNYFNFLIRNLMDLKIETFVESITSIFEGHCLYENRNKNDNVV